MMASWVLLFRSPPDAGKSDFAQIWFAARVLLDGMNPYEMIGPGLAYDWPGHFYYPLTAAVAALPLAPLSMLSADVAVVVLSTLVFAWVMTRYGAIGIVMLASPSVVMALQLGQWSPLFTCALLVPALGCIYAVKPTIGAAMFVARPSWFAVLGGSLLVVLSLAIQPDWPLEWIRALRSTDVVGSGPISYTAPIARPGGFVLLLALLRWRRPEARLIAGLALVPQTPLLYETVPLLIVAASMGQALWFLGAGWAALALEGVLLFLLGPLNSADITGSLVLVLFFLPALIMVLRRPNVGRLPRRIERGAERSLPHWLRGEAPK